MSRKVLLLGGTGAIGHYLVGELAAIGCSVVVTTRSEHDDEACVRYINGDARDNAFLRLVLAETKPDAIIDFMIYPTFEFLDRYKLLLESTSHYFFLSSYTVFADNSPITEDSPRLLDVCIDADFLRTDDYPLKKARCENILRNSGYQNWTILRPSITYSTNRFQFGCLEADTVCYRSFQNLPVVIASEVLDKTTTLTWAGDTAKMIARLVFNKAAMCEAFNLATAESLKWRDIASIYEKAIGLKYIEIPLKKYIGLCGLSGVMYDRMFNRSLDNSKVLAVTGLKQSELRPVADGLKSEAVAFKLSPRYKKINLQQNAQIDRLCSTRIDLSEYSLRQKISYLRMRYDAIGRIADVASAFKRMVV